MINNQKIAWCTYVSTKDYIIPALTLGEQLKKVNSKYPLVIAMTQQVYLPYKKLILQMGYIPEFIETVEYHKYLKEDYLKNNRLLNTSSRISIFQLKKYDKLVFIDADVLITCNVDELFNYFDGSMVRDENIGEHIKYDDRGGFEGLMVISPKNHSFDLYKFILENKPIMTSNLFSSLLFPIKSNHDYLIPVFYFYDFKAAHMIKEQGVKIYHWASNKPWDLIPDDELYNTEEVQSYMKMYNEVKDKANSFLT